MFATHLLLALTAAAAAATTTTTTLATTLPTTPETKCFNPRHQRVPSPASCDIALTKLHTLLVPYYHRDTIRVGASRTSDIRLWKAFADDSPDHPPYTPRCSILIVWDPDYAQAQRPYPVSPNAWDELRPNQLLGSAQRICDYCVAAPVPAFGNEHVIPHQWVLVSIEAFFMTPADGNWTMATANGTTVPVDASNVNPVPTTPLAIVPASVNGPVSGVVETS